MSFSEAQQFPGDSNKYFAQIINSLNIGFWEYDTETKKSNWSPGFYAILGYKPGEIECSYHNFIENILYYADKKLFLASTDHTGKVTLAAAQVRLLTKQNGYQWFESSSQKMEGANSPAIYGVLTNIHTHKTAQIQALSNDFLNSETGRIAKIGGWEIDAATMRLSLSKDIYDIFELKNDISLSIDEYVSFFESAYRTAINEAINEAISFCKPYDLEVLFRTAKNNVIWVRLRGIPVIDDLGKCKTVRGIFQDIDAIKKRGLTLQSSINLLDDQNKRLQNFAYIVSHNLRSHAGNLKFMVNLYEDAQLKDEQEEIFLHIKTISTSLNTTIDHLNEIVKIQTEIGKERKPVNFETIFNNIVSALSADIVASEAKINRDFSAATQIDYVPAYLESVMQNLLTNALKYKHPERKPVINCKTVKDTNHTYLVVEDNGMGIDLQRHGGDIFGMYKTFHQNKDAKGIGLFITRNQVEALGGSIQVDSIVNSGTKFTVKLV